MIDNLLGNAIRAAPRGTAVTVWITSGSDEHRVSVGDQGPGLRDADKERALDRFWRGDTTSPGTGLGLPIARRIVEASGGTIELIDNTPTGLVATVSLRAASTAGDGAEALSLPRP